MADNKKKATYDLIINGELANKSLKDLEGAARSLRAQFSLVTDPKELEELGRKYQSINSKIEEQKSLLKGSKAAVSELKDAFKEVAVAAGLAFSIEKVAEFAKESIKAYAEAEKGAILLKNQLTIVNGESSKGFRELREQAESISGLYDDSSITKVQLFFAQFGLGSEQIKKTIPAIVDTAAATGKTLDEVAEKVVQGANGSKKSLREWGIVVEDSGSKAKNLETIVGKLNDKFKGQAEIVETTSQGAIQRYTVMWEQFKENIGEDLILLFGRIADAAKAAFDPKGFAAEQAKRKYADQAVQIQETLSDLTQKGLADRLRQNKAALEATKREMENYAGRELNDAEKRRLALAQNDKTYYEQSIILTINELNKRKKASKAADDDLTQAGIDLREKLIEQQKKFSEDTDKLRQQTADLRIRSIKDDYEREYQLLLEKYRKEREEADKMHVTKAPGSKYSNAEIERNKAVNDQLLLLDENFLKDRDALYEKHNKALADKEFKADIENLEKWKNQEKLSLTEQRAKGIVDEETYQKKLSELNLQYLTLKLQAYKDYGQDTTQVEQDIQDAIIKIHDKTVQELLAKYKDLASKLSPEQQKVFAQLVEQLKVLIASGSDITDQAAQDILKKMEAMVSGTGKSFKQVFDTIVKDVMAFADQIGSIWQSMNTIADNRDKARLNRLHENLNKERTMFDKLLKEKRISQAEYDKQTSKLNEQEEKENKKAQREAAIRNQKLAIFRAELNAFQAISTTLSEYPFPVNIALAALTAFAAYKQVEAIKSEPLPELGTGGILDGPKHNSPSRGMTVLGGDGKPVMKLEGGEIVGSAAFVERNPELSRAILQASRNNGEMPSYITDAAPAFNISQIGSGTAYRSTTTARVTVPEGTNTATTTSSTSSLDSISIIKRQNELLEAQHAAIQELNAHLKRGISAKFVYRDYMKEIDRLNTIAGTAG